MGNSSTEGGKPIKSKIPISPPRNLQEQHYFYLDWAAIQAYYGAGAMPPPYFNPGVVSGHAAHPYMWAPPQMMQPYGSPYAAVYPHAGIYRPHASHFVATPLPLETPTRSVNSGLRKKHEESNDRVASSNRNVNSNGTAEYPGDGGDHGLSHSTDCGTEGSCDGSDGSTEREDNNRSENWVTDSGSCPRKMILYPSIDAHVANGMVQAIPLASSKPIGSTPMTTREMNDSSCAKADANAVNIVVPVAPCLSGIGSQDEEFKREKRKQSNRESARRSRLRKQAEMEELERKVDSLTVENMSLRSEVNKLIEDSEKLRSDNAALMEKLGYEQRPAAGEMVACDRIVNNSAGKGNHDRGGQEK